MISALLLADLRRDEGLRLRAYPDPLSGGDPWTIGYGHTGADVHPSAVWTLEEAETSLDEDIARVEHGLDSAIPWWRHLDEVRQAALVNMAFNLGVHGLLQFKHTLDALDRGAYSVAADGVLASLAARQLPERYGRIAHMILTGERL